MLEKQSMDEFLFNINKGKAVIVSLSPQSRASFAIHFGLSPLQVQLLQFIFLVNFGFIVTKTFLASLYMWLQCKYSSNFRFWGSSQHFLSPWGSKLYLIQAAVETCRLLNLVMRSSHDINNTILLRMKNAKHPYPCYHLLVQVYMLT